MESKEQGYILEYHKSVGSYANGNYVKGDFVKWKRERNCWMRGNLGKRMNTAKIKNRRKGEKDTCKNIVNVNKE